MSYIARLTGEAAEKVLNQVDQAKAQHDHIASETRRIGALIVKDPVAAVAKGHVMNFITDVEQASKKVDEHLTEIMMAQDFHDLTGQVIAKVVNLAATIEEQLVLLLVQTAPPDAQAKLSDRRRGEASPSLGRPGGRWASLSRGGYRPVAGRRPVGEPGLLDAVAISRGMPRFLHFSFESRSRQW